MENYLKILSQKNMKIIIKFRTTNYRIPTETGRWQGKPLGERFCTLCKNCQIGDKFHYIHECDTIQNIRKYFSCNFCCQRPNVIKFTELMSTYNETLSWKKKLHVYCENI